MQSEGSKTFAGCGGGGCLLEIEIGPWLKRMTEVGVLPRRIGGYVLEVEGIGGFAAYLGSIGPIYF